MPGIAAATARPARLFAYGTLQPGRLRWPFVEPYAIGSRPAAVPGLLFDSGNGWPVAVFEPSPSLVPGTLVDLSIERLDEVLDLLDEVEATGYDLMARGIVATMDGELAWAYHCRGPTTSMVRIDRWQGVDER